MKRAARPRGGDEPFLSSRATVRSSRRKFPSAHRNRVVIGQYCFLAPQILGLIRTIRRVASGIMADDRSAFERMRVGEPYGMPDPNFFP